MHSNAAVKPAVVYDFTDLKPYLTPTALRVAAERFPHRFSEQARMTFLEKDPAKCRKAQLTRELFKVFRDADEAEAIRSDAAFVRNVEALFSRDDTGTPAFQFKVNGDMLFVCIENHDHRDRDGNPEPQLTVVGLIRLDDNGKPMMSRFSANRQTCRAPQYGRKGGVR